MGQNKPNKLPINPESYSPSQILRPGRFPSWLHRKLPRGANLSHTQEILTRHRLNTVCEEARCPNRFECYSNHTATFLALGNQCTRNCGFCDIDFSKTPKQPEVDEPSRIALCTQELGLKHVVITMVARDDLIDKGASHMAAIIHQIRIECKEVTVEVLTSDFSEDYAAIDLLLQKQPDIFNHNLETVEELTPRVRHKATYLRSLNILSYVKQSHKAQFIKSGLMVGLGETSEQVKRAIDDLKTVGCDILTIGQYLQANRKKLLVKEFIKPEQFQQYAEYGREVGIKQMFCGPFIRSSYHAHEIKNLMIATSS